MTYEPGQSLRGYKIHHFVQAGGFSSVYQAFQDSVYRNVAIKVIENDQLVKSSNFIRRFEVEARIIARLEHPHIVPIYDFWREPDRAFIVMRWLEGGSLRDLFDRNDNLRFNKEMMHALITHIGAALHFVHQRDIVHRDIKPDNILIDDSGNFYLTDFGIAIDMQKRAEVDAEFLRIGTPDYMSPEQILDDIFTPRSDIYAFAILLYEVLTKELPFYGEDMDTILMQHVNVPFPSILPLRPDLPFEIDDVFVKATHKIPEQRYNSVLEFIQALLPLIDNLDRTSVQKRPATINRQVVDTIELSEPSSPAATNILGNLVMDRSNPYKGLKSFDEADADDFYGRDATISQMLMLLQQQFDHNNASFLAVIGASGSGKSSVVKAGLIQRLRFGELSGSSNWFYVTMTPGDNPLQTFVEKLNSIAIYGDESLLTVLKSNPEQGIVTIGEMVGQEHIFILIDQFEELFTQVSDETQRREFIDLVVKLCASTLNVTIVITLRADFYDKPLSYRELGQLIQSGTITVLPLSADELEQVIVQPANSVRVGIQTALVSQLVADTIRQPHALPLLQFTVTELFDQRNDDALTLDIYESMGRLQGAIVQRAESVFLSLNPHEREIAKRLFLQLVILSDSNETVRRRILWRDALSISPSRADVESVINQFGQSRLLTFDNDPMSRQPTIEVAHEALIQAWTRLQIWITENRSALLTHNRLMTSVRDWVENDRDNSFLARDAQLMQYEEIQNNAIIRLTIDEQAYLENSQSLRRRNQIIRYGVIVMLVALTLASVVVSFIARNQQIAADVARQEAVAERDRANMESQISQSRALAATALNIREDGRMALTTAIAANEIANTFEAYDSLANILSDHYFVQQYLAVDMAVRDMALSTDLQAAFIVGESNTIIELTLETMQPRTLVEIDNMSVINGVSVSPDDMLLAVGGQNSLAVIEIETGQIVYQVDHDSEIWSVDWSVDGAMVYLIDVMGTVVAINIEDQATQFEINVTPDSLFALGIHPDGTTLAVGGANNIVYILDAMSGEVLYEFSAHSNWVLSLTYSPDGGLLVSASADLSLIVWDLENLDALGQIPTRHTDWVRDVQFSPDGLQIVSASADGTLKRWDIETGRQISSILTRHSQPVWTAVYRNDGSILSADTGGHLIVWNLEEFNYPQINSTKLDSQFSTVADIGDLNQIVVATTKDNESASLVVVNSLSGQIVNELPISTFVTNMDYDANNQQLVIAGIDQTLRLLDMSNPTEVVTFGGHQRIIADLAVSPDGSTVVSIDDGEQLIHWNIDLQKQLTVQDIPDVSGVSVVQFLNEDELLIADRTGKIIIWNITTAEVEHRLNNEHDGTVTDLLLDGSTMYSVGHDSMIVAWDIETWEIKSVFPMVHTDWIMDVAKVNDSIIATIGRDGQLLLWDVARQQVIGQPLRSLSTDWGLDVVVATDTQQAFTFYRDGYIAGWELSLDDWMRHACHIVDVDTFLPDDNRQIDPFNVCTE